MKNIIIKVTEWITVGSLFFVVWWAWEVPIETLSFWKLCLGVFAITLIICAEDISKDLRE